MLFPSNCTGREDKNLGTIAGLKATLLTQNKHINRLLTEHDLQESIQKELKDSVDLAQDELKQLREFVQSRVMKMHNEMLDMSKNFQSQINDLKHLHRVGLDIRTMQPTPSGPQGTNANLDGLRTTVMALEETIEDVRQKQEELRLGFLQLQRYAGKPSWLSDPKLNGMSDDRKMQIISLGRGLQEIMSTSALRAGQLALSTSDFPDEDKKILYETLLSTDMQEDTISPISRPEPKTPAADEFVIQLQRGQDDKIGLILREADSGKALLVDRIQDGIFLQNSLRYPGETIREGDQIVAVNHKRGTPKVLTNLIRGLGVGLLVFTFRRAPR